MKKLITTAVLTALLSTLTFAQGVSTPEPEDSLPVAPVAELQQKQQECDKVQKDLVTQQKVIVEVRHTYSYHRRRGNSSQASSSYARMQSLLVSYTKKYNEQFVPLKADVESLKKRVKAVEDAVDVAQKTADDAVNQAKEAKSTGDEAKKLASTSIDAAKAAQDRADLANRNALTGILQGNNAMVVAVIGVILALIALWAAFVRRSHLTINQEANAGGGGGAATTTTQPEPPTVTAPPVDPI